MGAKSGERPPAGCQKGSRGIEKEKERANWRSAETYPSVNSGLAARVKGVVSEVVRGHGEWRVESVVGRRLYRESIGRREREWSSTNLS